MRPFRFRILVSYAALAVFAVVYILLPAFMVVKASSSTNYSLQVDGISNGRSSSGSTNYDLTGLLNVGGSGESLSSSFKALIGFLYFKAPNKPLLTSATVVSSSSITWNITDQSSDEQYFALQTTDSHEITRAGAGATDITETGLGPNMAVSRQVVAGNVFGISAAIDSISARTYAAVPGAPVLTEVVAAETDTTATDVVSKDITIGILANGNPAGTQYYVSCDGLFVQADGSLAAAPQWSGSLTLALNDLAAESTHNCFAVARNADNIITRPSVTSSITVSGDSSTEQPPVATVPTCIVSLSADKVDSGERVVAIITPTGDITKVTVDGRQISPTEGVYTYIFDAENSVDVEAAVFNNSLSNTCTATLTVNKTIIERVRDVITKDIPETVTKTIDSVVETIRKAVARVAEVVRQTAAMVAKTIQEVADNPRVEEASVAAAPLVVTVTAANVVAGAGLANIGPILLRLWQTFTEPFLLLSGRRRTPWGVVYNSMTKLPIDLAIVRLFNAETGKILGTRVTDKQGRFGFIIKPGTYKLTVTKSGFIAPSGRVMGDKDEAYEHLYHGDTITVKDRSAFLNLNIPIDPSGEKEKNVHRTVKLMYWLRRLNSMLSFLGPLIGVVIYYIIPTTVTFALMIMHIALFFVFMIFIRARKIKPWGRVYDAATRKFLSNAIVRIFDAKYNDLLTTQITDRKGRFGFFVGPSSYKVIAEKEGYVFPSTSLASGYKGDIIAVSKKEQEVISFNIPMDKRDVKVTADFVSAEEKLEKEAIAKTKMPSKPVDTKSIGGYDSGI